MSCINFAAANDAEINKTNNIASDFRTSDQADSSRFVIDLLHNPEYNIQASGDKVVINIKNAAWGDIEYAPKYTMRIAAVRHYALPNNELQVVLDIKNGFIIKKHFVLPPKNNLYRLVVDIAPNGNNITTKTTEEFLPQVQLKAIKKIVIALDAGHGGHDPGTTGYHNYLEKNITLSYVREIENELLSDGRYKVVLTRSDDSYIDLKKRVEIAQNAKANMFISVHADAHNNRQMQGFSIYTLSEKASDKEAEALALKENNAGILNEVDTKGEDINGLLIDLVQRETKNLSADLAENIIGSVKGQAELLHTNPHRFAGFRVLTAPDIPSVLIELGYLSNKDEERLLVSQLHRKKLAQAIVRAIDEHFKKYPAD